MVTRQSRLLDLVSLALVLVGTSCYGWAYVGMESLRTSVHDPGAPIFAGYTRFVRLSQLSWLGLAIIVLGGAVGIGAALHARHHRRLLAAQPGDGAVHPVG